MSERPATYRHLWGLFAFVVLASFAVLGGFGFRIASEAPPIPDKVYAGDKLLVDGETIRGDQNVWQSLGGMEIGSVWGHGAYIAPDWSADWLHRELVFVLDRWAKDEGAAGYDSLPPERQAALRERLKQHVRGNGYDPSTGVLTIDPVRGEAFEANAAHYADVFANGRPEYAIPAGALTDPERQRAMNLGLLLMVAVSLLPLGMMQTWAAVEHGTWYARSPEFLQTPTVQTLHWLRIPGDTLFALGVLAMGWFKLGLLTGHSFVKESREVEAGRLTAER